MTDITGFRPTTIAAIGKKEFEQPYYTYSDHGLKPLALKLEEGDTNRNGKIDADEFKNLPAETQVQYRVLQDKIYGDGGTSFTPVTIDQALNSVDGGSHRDLVHASLALQLHIQDKNQDGIVQVEEFNVLSAADRLRYREMTAPAEASNFGKWFAGAAAIGALALLAL